MLANVSQVCYNPCMTPSLSSAIHKKFQINVRVSPQLKDRLSKMAQKRGMSVSEYVRLVLEWTLREEESEVED
jgi:predicted HicB family RNase H-like nuclease